MMSTLTPDETILIKKTMLEFSARIGYSKNQEEVCQLLSEGLQRLVRNHLMAIYEIDHQQGILIPIILNGPFVADQNNANWAIPVGRGIVGTVCSHSKGEMVNNAHLDPRSVYPENNLIEQEHLIAIPLVQSNHCWGVFTLARFTSEVFTTDEFETAQFLASYASLALTNIQLLRKSRSREASIRSLLASIPDKPIKSNLRGQITDDFLERDGRHVGELADLFEPEIVQRLLPLILRSAETNTVETLDFIQDFEAEKRNWEIRIIPVSDQEVLLLNRDVTEFTQVKSKLQEAQALKQIVYDTISDGLVTVDARGNIITANDGIHTIFGYSAEELLGRELEVLIPEYLKEIHRIGFNNYLTTGVRKLHTWNSLELPGIHKDGHLLTLEVSFGETKSNGQRIFTASIRDIAERKRAEEKLKSTTGRLENLIRTIQAGVLVEDENRRVVLANDVFCQMFHIPVSADQLTGADCEEAANQAAVLFREPGEFIQRIGELIQNKLPIVNEEIEMADGFVYSRDYVPIFIDNLYRGHMWLYRDITQNKHAQLELLQAKKLAEDSLQAKQNFLAKMSHELRTPINGILGLTNLMLNLNLPAEHQEYLKGINSSGGHLLAIINDILDLAKIEAGKINFSNVNFSIHKVIQSIYNNFRFQATEKKIDLEMILDPSLPVSVNGDQVRVSQILLNLCSNALKFTSSGSVKVQTALVSEDKTRSWIMFTVTDTGIGIPPERQEAIFDRFTQASKDTSVRYGGTGLGLAIVKELVERMNGRIELQSQVGSGSSFRVTLPFQKVKSSGSAAEEGNVNPWENLTPFNTGYVLIVEDNPMNQLVTRKTVEQWNLQADIAENGLIALEMLSRRSYDVVLMDVEMPEMDGLEATQKIRTTLQGPMRTVPIIAMTASVLYDPEQRVKEVGMNDYLSKPFKPYELYAAIAKYLNPENKSEPNAYKYLDMSYLNSIAPDAREFQLEMVDLFARQSGTYTEQIRQAIAEENMSEVYTSAHAMKPTGSYIGASVLSQLLEQLEVAATRKSPIHEINQIFDQILKVRESILEEITLFKKDYEKSKNSRH